MLKLQAKLLFRSKIRLVILGLLLLGGLSYYTGIVFWLGIDSIAAYGSIDLLRVQMDAFIFFFILLLYLSYDYFGEAMEAEALEIAKTSRNYLKSDAGQFFISA